MAIEGGEGAAGILPTPRILCGLRGGFAHVEVKAKKDAGADIISEEPTGLDRCPVGRLENGFAIGHAADGGEPARDFA
jgi:hypothetical protein